MNPEFHRNLLLELSLHRLVAMPLILLLFYGAVGLVGNSGSVSYSATLIIIGVLVVWGSRLAVDTVLGEVTARTWDAQRMSALGPWSMSWGKLLGSTIFVWYGAALSIPAMFYGQQADLPDLLRLFVIGLFSQVLALFAGLAIQRLRPQKMRFLVTQAQLIGIAGAFILWRLFYWRFTDFHWFGSVFDNASFTLFWGLIFVLWCCFGVYRLMRGELQFRCWPVGWAAFTLFCGVYFAGFMPSQIAGNEIFASGGAVKFQLLWAHVVLVGLTWLAVFAEPKGFVRLRRWRDTIRSGSPREILRVMPSWAPGLLMALGTGVLLSAFSLLVENRYDYAVYRIIPFAEDSVGVFAVALVLFLLRDIAILHFLTMDGKARRVLLSALVYFAVLYALLPTILFALDLKRAIPALLPSPFGHPVVAILPVLLQIGVVAGLIGWRWSRLARTMDAA